MFNNKKRRHLIVNQEDIITILEVLDGIKRNTRGIFGIPLYEMEIGNCGWANEPEKWYMFFTISNKKWRIFIMELEQRNHKLILDENSRLHLK